MSQYTDLYEWKIICCLFYSTDNHLTQIFLPFLLLRRVRVSDKALISTENYRCFFFISLQEHVVVLIRSAPMRCF